MKTKNVFLFFCTMLFVSCGDPGGDIIYEGFSISIYDRTETDLDYELYIGGFLQGNFIPTESLLITNVELENIKPLTPYFDQNNWKPDLNEIKNLPSDRCYFKIKLSDGREELLTAYSSNELFSLLMPDESNFSGRFGALFISIDTDETWANVAERID